MKIEGYGKNELFLAITIYHRPKRGVRTEKAGWTSEPSNWHDEEVPEILTRISNKKLLSSAVIIDIKKDKLVRNRFQKTTPEDILKHFKSKYASYFPNFETETIV